MAVGLSRDKRFSGYGGGDARDADEGGHVGDRRTALDARLGPALATDNGELGSALGTTLDTGRVETPLADGCQKGTWSFTALVALSHYFDPSWGSILLSRKPESKCKVT
jgi:hypothetical protein